ncbi:MAG: hypothetical protein GXW90_03735 [Tepidanaerobacter acetatoxydans]|jgi:hypothetical protein|uniref:hypothetical protein n=1 Tax=Tepidanaerobacter TaxID=499228 RepID=UPI000AE595ED|nr:MULTISPECIES: hypothetical protein [Tepidanaerobacter]NLU10053.1 hypothetical protein [Tepidanaerobacter acetatoxydans]
MKKCAYQGCLLEAKPGSLYCKYHARMIEIEDKYPQWLKDMIEQMKMETKNKAKVECGK